MHRTETELAVDNIKAFMRNEHPRDESHKRIMAKRSSTNSMYLGGRVLETRQNSNRLMLATHDMALTKNRDLAINLQGSLFGSVD